MNKDALLNNLLDFDRDAELMFGNNGIKYKCYIVGGGALLILNLIPRVTHDIDVLNCTGQHLISLMADYDININVSAHIECFADGYQERATKIDLDTKLIDFYTLSVEDLVVSKLASGRKKDMEDIHHKKVVDSINWDKLDELIELTTEGMLSDFSINELRDFYKDYKEEYKK
ncbi:DUF6036 family nucleotidyltransferase [uncultured Eubacterium sp.]|uniref:DUF6036 family nucleotidyltransferase n=1 Tax=uncultured Eubacterium sp. TaxID=165185 RepID=UPI0025F07FBC|nr:DUF6036 family nucleotidyltransferase [uncultured Eubacterium sp.]